jgi:hypothetical protein
MTGGYVGPYTELPVLAANRERPPLRVVPANYCLVHDETYDRICRGCRADAIAAPDNAEEASA